MDHLAQRVAQPTKPEIFPEAAMVRVSLHAADFVLVEGACADDVDTRAAMR